MIRHVQVGERFPDLIHNGHVLPVGATVGHSPTGSVAYTHAAPRLWLDTSDRPIDVVYLNAPKYLHDPGEVDLPAESAAMLRWRLRDSALSAAERSGVRTDPVLRMAAQFGASVPLLTVGGIVSSRQDIDKLPVDSIVYSGHPDKPSHCDVWTVTEQGLKHLLGPRPQRDNGRPVTIYSIPGQHAVPDDSPTDEATLERIALKAWRVGKVFKRQNNWCGVFEETLASLGINPDTLALAIGESVRGPGDVVTPGEAATLPLGTLLYWRWGRGHGMAVYRRVEGTRNKAGTRRVWGDSDDNENSHGQMTIVETPAEGMTWAVNGSDLRRMPDGTKFLRSGIDGTAIVLDKDTRNSVEHWQLYTIKGWEL